MSSVDDFESQFGEAFVGQGADAAHLNTVLGAKGGPVEGAWATSLATPTVGHQRFVVVARPGVPVKPFTLFVPKAEVRPGTHEIMTWGAAQAGVAGGVVDALAAGVVDPALADRLLLIAAVWVDPAAHDADAVYANNRAATLAALRAGAAREPALDDVLAAGLDPYNPFYP
ncbi:MAG TPA: formaldehyde-activating enzyme [Acidimicrobiales bacterium]|nr:formaldehyde-activating enzyme [Acidimicrobiales bacterium]